jgi:hypothetical protein
MIPVSPVNEQIEFQYQGTVNVDRLQAYSCNNSKPRFLYKVYGKTKRV